MLLVLDDSACSTLLILSGTRKSAITFQMGRGSSNKCARAPAGRIVRLLLTSLRRPLEARIVGSICVRRCDQQRARAGVPDQPRRRAALFADMLALGKVDFDLLSVMCFAVQRRQRGGALEFREVSFPPAVDPQDDVRAGDAARVKPEIVRPRRSKGEVGVALRRAPDEDACIGRDRYFSWRKPSLRTTRRHSFGAPAAFEPIDTFGQFPDGLRLRPQDFPRKVFREAFGCS